MSEHEATFDMNEMSNAIEHSGNMNAEAAALAREKGWAEPQRYNYDIYTASFKPGDESADRSHWASNAAKYEWNDEYGDVGPQNEELEKMLFRDEYTNRAGDMFKQ